MQPIGLFPSRNYEIRVILIKEYKASGDTVYLLVNTILKITLHLHMLYKQLEDQQVAPPIIFISGAMSPFTKGLCPVGTISGPDKHNIITNCKKNVRPFPPYSFEKTLFGRVKPKI